MARIPRHELPEYAIFHVTSRGAGRIPIYRVDDDRRAFLGLLADVVWRLQWSCHAFCLMTNHYHLVVECFRQALSDGMQRLNGMYAQSFNMKYDRWGHLFGERFWCRPLDEDDLGVVCNYVLDNPVRADMTPREGLMMAAMIAGLLWLGFYPQPVLNTFSPAMNHLQRTAQASTVALGDKR